MSTKPCLDCPCEKQYLNMDYEFKARLEGETFFDLKGQKYYRSYLKCQICSHWFGEMDINMDDFYDDVYVDSVY